MPDQPSAVVPAADLVAWARAALAQEPTAAHDLGLVAPACLDLTTAHQASVAELLTSGTSRLSVLLRDGDHRPIQLARVRRFRLAVADLAEEGLRGGYAVSGLVEVAQAQVPVLLKPCVLQPAPGGDAEITLSGAWRLNPFLVSAVIAATAGAVELGGELQAALSELGTSNAAPDESVERVAVLLAGSGLQVARRLVLAPVTLDRDRALGDLERVAALVAAHPILAAVADQGDDTVDSAAAVRPRGVERRRGALPGGPAAAEALDAAMDDVLTTPLDAHQRTALRHVLSGLNLVVDAPAATGATTLAAAVAALAVTTGRRCLVLTPTRTQGDVVIERLRRGGVAQWIHGDASADDPDDTADPAGTDDPAVTVQDAARRDRDAAAAGFAAARYELTGPREPWQVSRLDSFDALARLDSEPAALRLVWPTGPRAELTPQAVATVIDAVVRALTLGAADRGSSDSPWAAASLSEPADAAAALDVAERLSDPLAQRVRRAVADLASFTGTASATTLAELLERRQLFTGLQRTLDLLVPEAFDMPLLDLVAATADHDRDHGGAKMSVITRRRLVARARRLVRPGVVVKRSELHSVLVMATEQRIAWQALSGGAGRAHVPAGVPEQIRVMTEFVAGCAELACFHPAFGAAAAPSVEGVIALATQLVAAAGDVTHLPEISRLEAVWTDAGLGDAVGELFVQWRVRARSTEEAATAVWRAYWTAVAAATSSSEQLPDTPALLRRYADSDARYRRLAPARARATAARAAGSDGWRVRVAVPADLADVTAQEHYDVLVIDAAGEISFARVVAAIARAGQVVVLGDNAHARSDSVLRRIRAVDPPLVHPGVLRHRHRPVVITHAAGGGTRETPSEITLVDPSNVVTFTHVSGALGLPAEGADYIETSDVEVAHVVERTLAMAQAAAVCDPPRSLAVVALTRTHAAAIGMGLRAALRAAPERAAPFTADTDEPVIVVSADQARGLERDLVLLSVGFPRTPHGRVLHRFGPLETESGPGLVATAVTRARCELHVVSGLRSADLDPSRLYSPGARAVSALLVGAELAAVATAPVEPATPAVPGGHEPRPVTHYGGPGAAVLALMARDMREQGLVVGNGVAGGGLTVTGPGGRRVAVDLDIQFADATAALDRQHRLDEGGWAHILLSAEVVAADRVTTATRIRQLVTSPVAAPADDGPVGPGSADESDIGWGEPPAPDAERDEQIRGERPPHW